MFTLLNFRDLEPKSKSMQALPKILYALYGRIGDRMEIEMGAFNMKKFDGFFEAICKLSSVAECRKFFEDVCTIKEIEDMSGRLDVARLLREGKSYQEVSKLTGASTATISRVNKCLNYGAGGYSLVLEEDAANGNQ